MQPLESVFAAAREATENIKAEYGYFIKLKFKYFAAAVKKKIIGNFGFCLSSTHPPPPLPFFQ